MNKLLFIHQFLREVENSDQMILPQMKIQHQKITVLELLPDVATFCHVSAKVFRN